LFPDTLPNDIEMDIFAVKSKQAIPQESLSLNRIIPETGAFLLIGEAKVPGVW
jgi:hypothetical protein